MSRIGKKPVILPAGVTATITPSMDATTVAIKGPKGELTLTLHPHASVEQKKDDEGRDYLDVTVIDGENEDRAMWGTMRALLAQMVEGVTNGYTKALELNGVGFKMNLQGTTLVMSLGFSHDVRYELPNEVAAKIEQNVLTLTSANLPLLGQVAAEIRGLKKPEPYKGKGFRYTDEVIRRKAGKAAKSAE
ncbi:50S ribosomal protein L6 [Candidatus Uhrbacteria bacterium]|nr:50S ribosomal protein L6 [Candidatus Uhrbacteria bacterium]